MGARRAALVTRRVRPLRSCEAPTPLPPASSSSPPSLSPFQNAWVTGISTEGDIEGRPVEKVQFKCRTFAISQYTLSVPAQPGKNRCFCWDLAVYGKCTTATCPPGATPL